MPKSPHKKKNSKATPSDRCNACMSALESGAKLCPVCKSYQSRVKFFLQSYSHLGLIALALALLPWSINQIATVYELMFGEEAIEVISLSEPGTTVFLNSGTRAIYVTDIFVHSPGIGSRSRSIGLLIEPETIKEIETPPQEGWRVITSPEPSFNLRSHFLRSECVQVAFKSESNRSLMQLRATLGDRLATWPGYVEIRYYGSRGNSSTLTQTVTVVASANYECRERLEAQGLRQMWISN